MDLSVLGNGKYERRKGDRNEIRGDVGQNDKGEGGVGMDGKKGKGHPGMGKVKDNYITS